MVTLRALQVGQVDRVVCVEVFFDAVHQHGIHTIARLRDGVNGRLCHALGVGAHDLPQLLLLRPVSILQDATNGEFRHGHTVRLVGDGVLADVMILTAGIQIRVGIIGQKALIQRQGDGIFEAGSVVLSLIIHYADVRRVPLGLAVQRVDADLVVAQRGICEQRTPRDICRVIAVQIPGEAVLRGVV